MLYEQASEYIVLTIVIPESGPMDLPFGQEGAWEPGLTR